MSIIIIIVIMANKTRAYLLHNHSIWETEN